MSDQPDSSSPPPLPLGPSAKPAARSGNLIPVPPAPSLSRPPAPAAAAQPEKTISAEAGLAPAVAQALRHRAVVGPTEWVDETFRIWGVTKFALVVALVLAVCGGLDLAAALRMTEMGRWGLIAGLVTGILLLSILPGWLTWKWTKFRETPTNFIFATMLGVVSVALAVAVMAVPAFQAMPQLIERRQLAAENVGTAFGEFKDSPKMSADFYKVCVALERLEAAGGPDATSSAVLARFIRQMTDNGAAMEAGGVALASLPSLPSGGPPNPEGYAPFINAYDGYAKTVRAQNAFLRGSDAKFTALADEVGDPAALTRGLIVEYRKGFNSTLPLNIEFTAAFDKGLAAMAECYRIMQANNGRWKFDDEKFAVFDDPAAQAKFDAQYKIHLDELDKAGELEEKLAAVTPPAATAAQ